ncbi:MAG: beta-class carbonic anhydrase [Acidimicrobiales bacterium]
MSVIDELLSHNRAYVARHGHREMPTTPQLHLAVLTCMDSRLDLFGALGLDLGEVHLIRNAGGIASDDAVRSLLLSQRLLGTESIMVIHHTRCGLESFDEETLQAELETEFGERPPFRLGAYRDVDADVLTTVETLRRSPFVNDTEIRGFVFNVDDGDLREVTTNQ